MEMAIAIIGVGLVGHALFFAGVGPETNRHSAPTSTSDEIDFDDCNRKI